MAFYLNSTFVYFGHIQLPAATSCLFMGTQVVKEFVIIFKTTFDSIDEFVNADAVTDFSKVYAVRLWVLIQTERQEHGLDTANNYTIAGTSVNTPNDGFRRLLVSSVIKMRNMVKVDEVAAAGSTP